MGRGFRLFCADSHVGNRHRIALLLGAYTSTGSYARETTFGGYKAGSRKKKCCCLGNAVWTAFVYLAIGSNAPQCLRRWRGGRRFHHRGGPLWWPSEAEQPKFIVKKNRLPILWVGPPPVHRIRSSERVESVRRRAASRWVSKGESIAGRWRVQAGDALGHRSLQRSI